MPAGELALTLREMEETAEGQPIRCLRSQDPRGAVERKIDSKGQELAGSQREGCSIVPSNHGGLGSGKSSQHGEERVRGFQEVESIHLGQQV